MRKANKKTQDIGKPDTPPEYDGKDRLSELSWFKRGEKSRRWPARFTDESGNVITSAEEIDWNGWNELEGLSAEIEFASKVNEAFANAFRPKDP